MNNRKLNRKLAKSGHHIKVGQERAKAEKYLRKQGNINKHIDEPEELDNVYDLLEAKKNTKPYRDHAKSSNLKGFWSISNKYLTNKKVITL